MNRAQHLCHVRGWYGGVYVASGPKAACLQASRNGDRVWCLDDKLHQRRVLHGAPAAGCHSLTHSRCCTKASRQLHQPGFCPQSFGRRWRRRVINVYMSEYSYRFSIMPELTALCVKSLVVNNGAGRVITTPMFVYLRPAVCAYICGSLAPKHTLYYILPRARIPRCEFCGAECFGHHCWLSLIV